MGSKNVTSVSCNWQILIILYVSFFQGLFSCHNIMVAGSENRNCLLGFELQTSHAIEKRAVKH